VQTVAIPGVAEQAVEQAVHFPEARGGPEGYSEVSELNSYYLTTLD